MIFFTTAIVAFTGRYRDKEEPMTHEKLISSSSSDIDLLTFSEARTVRDIYTWLNTFKSKHERRHLDSGQKTTKKTVKNVVMRKRRKRMSRRKRRKRNGEGVKEWGGGGEKVRTRRGTT